MSNDVFSALFREQADIFRTAFSGVSTEVFYDPENERLRHAGEFGMYRESIVRDFLRFIVPRNLDIDTGFVITGMNDVSTQCDVVIFDHEMTPLYQEGNRQRFFPVESVFCLAEVKSTLSKAGLKEALSKLACNKALGERISNPTVLRRTPPGRFDPVEHHYDSVPSVLICQNLDFDVSTLEVDIDEMYDEDVEHRHKHNMILSVEDGILAYYDENGKTLPYPRFKRNDLKHRFTMPGENPYPHFQLFASYMFLITSSKTLLYPEVTDYIGSIEGGVKRDEA